jgi:hypothetical protein
MPRFSENDRVAVHGDPDRCGTVKEIIEAGPHTTTYLISWDDKAVGTRDEEDLIPCPGSHTDQG